VRYIGRGGRRRRRRNAAANAAATQPAGLSAVCVLSTGIGEGHDRSRRRGVRLRCHEHPEDLLAAFLLAVGLT